MFPISTGNNKKNREKGVFIAEILIVAAIIAIALVTFLGIVVFSLKASSAAKEKSQAVSLAEEMIEAVRNFRDGTNWDIDGLETLNTGVDYCPSLTGNPPVWTLVLGAETISNFNRKLVLSRVSRDPFTNDIESSYNPANDDPDTRKVIASVSWQNGQIEIETYFTNWRQ